MASSFDVRFHQMLIKEIGDADESGLLRETQIDLSVGRWKTEAEARELVGKCAALRQVLDIAEEIRKKLMEQ